MIQTNYRPVQMHFQQQQQQKRVSAGMISDTDKQGEQLKMEREIAKLRKQ